MRRDWTEARAKVEREGRCRVCGATGQLDAAHLIPRSQVGPGPGEHPDNIVVLCRAHHRQYDLRTLDILPYLSLDEQAYAVGLVGLQGALRRLTGTREAA
jgi:5-methylcytosine-specific restriction endonuclease McrA